jgi:hypothetical protein
MRHPGTGDRNRCRVNDQPVRSAIPKPSIAILDRPNRALEQRPQNALLPSIDFPAATPTPSIARLTSEPRGSASSIAGRRLALAAPFTRRDA